ncbi:carboxymuconolactone decarboxylase family protein [Actinomadura macra]|uniref:carboxymuconolactone decarboxylase family protein n=1 Tax=Actinomadura macra TaxID=46164 RepID=UPI00082D9C47|nr:carboxymuconolactone decarboxylase family protein [Actinomadura macra]
MGDATTERASAARRDEVRAAFVRERGFWAPAFEPILRVDPDYLAAYVEFSSGAWRRGSLEPHVKELMYIAVDAAVTHLHGGGTAAHIRHALRRGATPNEIVSVLELVSLLGLQSLEVGIPALLAACGESPPRCPSPSRCPSSSPATGSAGEDAWLDGLASLDPAGGEAARRWRDSVRARSPLAPKVIELVGVAVNASTTHLNAAATARHLRAALAAGATAGEVAEVLEIASVLGIHTATMAMPMLLAEVGADGPGGEPARAVNESDRPRARSDSADPSEPG